MSIYRHAKPCGFGCISLIPSRTKPDRFGYIRLIPTGAQPTGLDTPYLQSLNALTIDKATTGAVTADNTRSPKDTIREFDPTWSINSSMRFEALT